MSRLQRPGPLPSSDYVPLIAAVHRLNKLLQQDMVEAANRRGHADVKSSHNAVFATLDRDGGRPSDMAVQAGITRQSMGEVVRDMVGLGLVEMKPDPTDKRAKLVTWTPKGLATGQEGFEHIRDLEAHFAAEMGADAFAQLKESLDQARQIMLAYMAQFETETP
ncbi:MAG: MarR family winged helix-turn-helix transcriptional regulator [Propionibacteriales bacterium]|nr:MarR family winged helix-turn-helix transcriptional regulator [Propionibacteriales bacterium]